MPPEAISLILSRMDAPDAFARALEERLDARASHLDRHDLKKLRDAFKLFQTAFQGIHAVLLRKGVIQEDPYKYELKISEVGVPSESPFTENEKLEAMSIRLSQYESYLDFLNNYYQFSVDFLGMARIKRLLQLTRYFNFTQFAETSNQLNTRYFAEIVAQVRKGSDQLSSGILGEALLQLDRATREILGILKTLTDWHKERWKLELRKAAGDSLQGLERDWIVTHPDETVRKLRQIWTEAAGDKPFYPELAQDVLSEDWSSEAESLRDAVMKRLEVPEEKKSAQEERNFKLIILDGVRSVASSGLQLEDSLQKLMENHTLLRSADRSFAVRLGRAWRRLTGAPEPEVTYEVEFVEQTTSERKTEKVPFVRFHEEASRKASLYSSISSRNSAAYKRLESATEEQAFNYLERNLEEVQKLHKTMTALDEYFKGRLAETEFKDKVRGIKVELSSMKNAIIKANQKRYEYVAQREELEQFKKLGIRTDQA